MNIGMNPLVYKLWLHRESVPGLAKEYDALVEDMTEAKDNSDYDLVAHYATHINMVVTEVLTRDSEAVNEFYSTISY